MGQQVMYFCANYLSAVRPAARSEETEKGAQY